MHRGWRSKFKAKSYKQYLEIEIARRQNGKVDRSGLDEGNATSLKHGNKAGQCVCGLKINKLIGGTSHRLCTFSTLIGKIREIKYFNIWGLRKKERRQLRKKGGGGKIHPFHFPWIRTCSNYLKGALSYRGAALWTVYPAILGRRNL